MPHPLGRFLVTELKTLVVGQVCGAIAGLLIMLATLLLATVWLVGPLIPYQGAHGCDFLLGYWGG